MLAHGFFGEQSKPRTCAALMSGLCKSSATSTIIGVTLLPSFDSLHPCWTPLHLFIGTTSAGGFAPPVHKAISTAVNTKQEELLQSNARYFLLSRGGWAHRPGEGQTFEISWFPSAAREQTNFSMAYANSPYFSFFKSSPVKPHIVFMH